MKSSTWKQIQPYFEDSSEGRGNMFYNNHEWYPSPQHVNMEEWQHTKLCHRIVRTNNNSGAIFRINWNKYLTKILTKHVKDNFLIVKWNHEFDFSIHKGAIQLQNNTGKVSNISLSFLFGVSQVQVKFFSNKCFLKRKSP